MRQNHITHDPRNGVGTVSDWMEEAHKPENVFQSNAAQQAAAGNSANGSYGSQDADARNYGSNPAADYRDVYGIGESAFNSSTGRIETNNGYVYDGVTTEKQHTVNALQEIESDPLLTEAERDQLLTNKFQELVDKVPSRAGNLAGTALTLGEAYRAHREDRLDEFIAESLTLENVLSNAAVFGGLALLGIVCPPCALPAAAGLALYDIGTNFDEYVDLARFLDDDLFGGTVQDTLQAMSDAARNGLQELVQLESAIHALDGINKLLDGDIAEGVAAFADAAVDVVIPEELQNFVDENFGLDLDNIGDNVEEVLNNIGENVREVANQVSSFVQDAVEALENLPSPEELIDEAEELLTELGEEASEALEDAQNAIEDTLCDIGSLFGMCEPEQGESEEGGPGDPGEPLPVSPLIIDLDGDGVELVGLNESGVFFDLDADGFAELTGWALGDDGFLALDRNGNGRIDDITELFGNEANDGFTELSAFDTNNDWKISNEDSVFADLLVWRDANVDGISSTSELLSLSDYGIESIALRAAGVSETRAGHDVTHPSFGPVDGGGENDVLFAGDGDDSLFGGDGDDELYGGPGADFIDGGDGVDTITFASSVTAVSLDLRSPSLSTGESNGDVFHSIEVVIGTSLNDGINGSNFGETIIGGDGHDYIFAYDGNDDLYGSNGDDLIAGELGDDTLTGGDGEDVLLFSILSGNDIITDFNVGTDLIAIANPDIAFDDLIMSDISGGVEIDYSSGVNDDSSVTLIGVQSADLTEASFRLGTFRTSAIGAINGTSDDDIIYGYQGNDVINGGDGDDHLYGLGGYDTLNGQAGSDTLTGGTGNDRYYIDRVEDVVVEEADGGYDNVTSYVSFTLADHVEQGALLWHQTNAIALQGNGLDNWLSGNQYDNTLTDDQGLDRLLGFDGNDVLSGGSDVDILQGGNDNDTLFGGDGRDILEGGAGSDWLHGDAGRDRLKGGDGVDYFIATLDDDTDDVLYFDVANDVIDVSAIGVAFHEIVIGTASYGTSIVYHDDAGGFGQFLLHGVNFDALTFANFVTAFVDGEPVIEGTSGNDVLQGSIANDELSGGSGNDSIYGHSGADVMRGGSGNDRYFVENTGDVVIEFAAEGTDVITTSVSYALSENVEEITAHADAGAIDLTGNEMNNWVTGNNEDNELRGEDGSDRVYGNQGADRIIGGQGNDLLWGGASDGFEDVFVFDFGDGINTINDFEVGVDLIDLSPTGIEYANLQIVTSGADVQVRYYGEGFTDIAIVANVVQSDLTEESFIFV